MKFTDRLGRDWHLRLTVGMIEYIHECTEVDLDLLIKQPDELSELILMDPRKLGKMLWVICEEQAKSYGVEPKEFGMMFDRETLDKAGTALLEAVIDFYPRSSAGKVIRENFPRLVRKMDQEIEAKTRKHINRVLSQSSGEPIDSPDF